MWQLESDATNASSGSTCAAFDHGVGTTDGDADAGTVAPPSNVQVCSREYRPFRRSGPVRLHRIVALCSDIKVLHQWSMLGTWPVARRVNFSPAFVNPETKPPLLRKNCPFSTPMKR